MTHLNRCISLVPFLLVLAAVGTAAQQKPFTLRGIYVEGCSCSVVCTCALTGEMARGCRVMGAMIISSGTYGEADLSGTKIAFAIGDKWVRIFVQSQDPAQAETAGALGRALFSSYGEIESIRDAKIDLSGSHGDYTLKVDDGKVMELATQPVLGADKKTAVTYTNYPDPLFHTIKQAKVVSGRYNEGKHHFKLEGTNSFFNEDWNASGKI
jgi:hypothetical protein